MVLGRVTITYCPFPTDNLEKHVNHKIRILQCIQKMPINLMHNVQIYAILKELQKLNNSFSYLIGLTRVHPNCEKLTFDVFSDLHMLFLVYV